MCRSPEGWLDPAPKMSRPMSRSRRRDVRFALNNGCGRAAPQCPLCATTGLMRRSKQRLYSITSSARASVSTKDIGLQPKARQQYCSMCQSWIGCPDYSEADRRKANVRRIPITMGRAKPSGDVIPRTATNDTATAIA